MASPADNVQQLIADTRTAIQAQQIVHAHAAGNPAEAQRIAESMTTDDLQRVHQHLNQ